MKALSRNTEVDLIRLVALFGICVVNVPFMALPLEAQFSQPETLWDKTALFVVEALFQGKFFLLFSFVFGWGIHVQLVSAERSGHKFGPRFSRRLLGLAILGCAHAILVFSGDILLLYALLGIAIWPIRNWQPPALLRFAGGTIVVAFASLALVSVLVQINVQTDNVGNGLGGSYLEATATRLRDWPFTFGFIVLFNGPLALGAFAAGLAAERSRFFEFGNSGFERLKRHLPLLILVAVPLNLLYAATSSGMLPNLPTLLQFLGFIGLALGAPALSAVYLVCIVLFARRIQFSALWLAAGRNSLTGYVLSGIIAGFVFGGYGLGLFNTLGHAALLFVAIAIEIVGVALACAWEFVSKRGPLESLLRWITHTGEKGSLDKP
jgi:uncharacterized protein